VRSISISISAVLALASAVFAVAACSDDASSTPSVDGSDGGAAAEGGPSSDAGAIDDGGVDAGGDPGAEQEEAEPNDGKTSTEVGSMTLPGAMKGALDPANDVDLFSIAPVPGELWEWRLTPSGADLAPHLTIFDADADNAVNPTTLAKAAAGDTATLQHFVLGTGTLLAAVRDARNVPSPSGRGGPTYGYTLTAQRRAPAPTSITVPATKQGELASLASVDLYAFSLATTTDLDVMVHAEQKTPPSTLDPRVSIFSVTLKKSLGTNDNQAGTTDPKLGGTLPAGSYLVVVDNEGTNDADLSYELEIAPR
jgi:hypothetical protein